MHKFAENRIAISCNFCVFFSRVSPVLYTEPISYSDTVSIIIYARYVVMTRFFFQRGHNLTI